MKRILLLSILSLFLLSGCNQSNQNSASQSFKENDLDFTKTLEEEIKNVNLTGNGGDLIKAAYYTLNDDISFTILQVTLSTGQTVSVKFDGIIASSTEPAEDTAGVSGASRERYRFKYR